MDLCFIKMLLIMSSLPLVLISFLHVISFPLGSIVSQYWEHKILLKYLIGISFIYLCLVCHPVFMFLPALYEKGGGHVVPHVVPREVGLNSCQKMNE